MSLAFPADRSAGQRNAAVGFCRLSSHPPGTSSAAELRAWDSVREVSSWDIKKKKKVQFLGDVKWDKQGWRHTAAWDGGSYSDGKAQEGLPLPGSSPETCPQPAAVLYPPVMTAAGPTSGQKGTRRCLRGAATQPRGRAPEHRLRLPAGLGAPREAAPSAPAAPSAASAPLLSPGPLPARPPAPLPAAAGAGTGLALRLPPERGGRGRELEPCRGGGQRRGPPRPQRGWRRNSPVSPDGAASLPHGFQPLLPNHPGLLGVVPCPKEHLVALFCSFATNSDSNCC